MTEDDDANISPGALPDSHTGLESDPQVAERFARLQSIDAPNVWGRAVRAAGDEPAPTRRRWWAVAAAAALLVAAVIGIAITGTPDDRPIAEETASPSSGTDPSASNTVGGPTTSPGSIPVDDDLPELRGVVEPSSASPGDQVMVTPATEIQPTCTDIGSLYDLRSDPPDRLGMLGIDGSWIPEAPSMELPECLPVMSNLPATYTIPVDAPRGQFALCRNIEFSSDGCGLLDIVQPTLTGDVQDGSGDEARIADDVGLAELDVPTWFSTRTEAPSCGTVVGETSASEPWSNHPSLDCFSTAIESDERAQLGTVHINDELRVARWIVALGSAPSGAERFGVASLVVDERAGTTQWFEMRCVEGEFVAGRLVGGFMLRPDLVGELDPSGTIVSDNGDVLELPDPDARSQLQPCNGPTVVDRVFVTPFEATGVEIGDKPDAAFRFPGFNEVGEYDITVVPSWEPVAGAETGGVIGFVRSDALEVPPSPDAVESGEQFAVIYADDGVTRLGQFGPDGFPNLGS